MIEFALRSRSLRYQPPRRPPRWAALLVAVALVTPSSVSATPAADDLEARAVALDQDGHDIEAAALWEALAAETEDDDIRLVAYARALAAWERAYNASGEARPLCAARSILARALADERIADEGRRELAARGPALEAHAVDCSRPRVAMLADPPPSRPRPPPAAIDTPTAIDTPKRAAPQTIAGAVMIALAAPALGGFIYAAAEDRRIVRGFRRLDSDLDATGTYDEAEALRLKAEAPFVRGLAIGLGAAAAGLTGAAIGLLVAGRRAQLKTSISILPQARADLGGVVLRGRF